MASRVVTDQAISATRPPREEGQVCRQCLMDTSDPAIVFDDHGICNHCHEYDRRMREDVPAGDRAKYLEDLVGRIREAGKGKPYDCAIGISGGVDSTYVAWLCKKEFGLRPLAIHLDNGWNSELAVQNIEAVLRKLDIDLHTHVIDWEEFRDLQVAFLKSGIANWELPTDHAIRALLYREAARRGIKYIVTGSNLVTESIMPAAWMADNVDLRLLNSIHRRFGKGRLRTFPRLSLTGLAWRTFVRGIRQIPILNYVDYHKANAITLLERELGWRPYEFKHGESLFTRFFQRYYLPHKFGYDKRKPHLSNLILSGQITRDEGLAELNRPLYYPEELERDLAYVAKKLDLSAAELQQHIDAPAHKGSDYPNSSWIRRSLPRLVALARRVATARNFQRVAEKAGGTNVHIYPSPIGLESRIFRITESLERWTLFERIKIVGMHDGVRPVHQAMSSSREILRVRPLFPNTQLLPLRLARFLSWYGAVALRFRGERVACVNCHSLSTLPLGWLLKMMTGAKLVYDTHELETETMNTRGVKRWLAKLTEALFIRAADETIVVGPKIAEWYGEHYSGLRPTVIRNLPETRHEPGRLDLFRERLPIPDDALLFFYQGVLDEGRGVETTLAAFAGAPADRHIVFLGYGPKSKAIEEHARRHPNIHLLPAVPPDQLRSYTRSGDIGLCLIEPACLSYVYCLPNKLFEYMGSGVPVIATPLPEMSAIINSCGCGWTVENDPVALRQLITSISREEASARGAHGLQWTSENNWARECNAMRSVYSRLGFGASGDSAQAALPARGLAAADSRGH